MSNVADPEALEELPPSCVLVYRILRETGPAPFADVRDAGYLADRTCRRALHRLEEAGIVETRPGPDARVTFYDLDK